MTIKRALLGSAVSLVLLVLAPIANAIPIDLGQTIGSPASPTDELNRLNGQIAAYNVVNNPDLLGATLVGSSGQLLGGAGGVSIVLNVTGWDYLLLKWADTDQFYYVGGDTGLLTFNSTEFNANGQPQGLSHYDFFDPSRTSVPDGGSTMLLLGVTLSGLGMMVRHVKS